MINNKNNKGLKNSSIYSNDILAKNIYKIITDSKISTDNILEPSFGSGELVKFFKNNGSIIYGVDINDKYKDNCDYFYNQDFEFFDKKIDNIDIIISNPPFNGHKNRKLYPEVFLRQIVKIYGNKIPICMIIPSGLLLNQKINSKRWKWINQNLEITGIMTLPLDIFNGVLFHTNIVFFNIPNIKPHYFLNLDI